MPYRVTGRLFLETQSVYYDADSFPRFDKKVDVSGVKIPISLRDVDGREIAKTVTDSEGNFDFPMSRLPVSTDWLSITPFWSVNSSPKLAVFNANDETFDAWTWAIRLSSYVTKDDPGNLGNVRITMKQASGALYLFQNLQRAYEDLVKYGFVSDLNYLPSMAVLWAPGQTWNCGTCYQKQPLRYGSTEFATSMLVSGDLNGESAWGYPTILHEFGHYVLFQKRDDTAGGAHYLSGVSDPRLAWSEGWATFFSLEMMSLRKNAPETRYWRILPNGSFWLDYAHLYEGDAAGTVYVPKPSLSDPRKTYQNIGEGWISYILWDLWDGGEVDDPSIPVDGISFTSSEIFKAISSQRYLEPFEYYKESRCPADGFTTDPQAQVDCQYDVHFVHFLDALLCECTPENVLKVSNYVIDQQFPYDRSPVCFPTNSGTYY